MIRLGCAGWSASMLFAYGKTISDHFVPRSFRTQVISYHFSHFVPIFIFNLVISYQVWSLPVTRFVSTFTRIRIVSPTFPFRPLSLSPCVVSPPCCFVYYSVRPWVVSPTFPFVTRVVWHPYRLCFGLLIGERFVLFEILSYKQLTMNSVSDVYIRFQSWHR